MEKNNFEPQLYIIQAQKNWNEKGYLGVTAKDHEAINSTPDDILIENPGKTLGELMSEEEILEYLTGTIKNINENKEIEKLKDYNNDLKINLDITIKYLTEIGRLPNSFKIKFH